MTSCLHLSSSAAVPTCSGISCLTSTCLLPGKQALPVYPQPCCLGWQLLVRPSLPGQREHHWGPMSWHCFLSRVSVPMSLLGPDFFYGYILCFIAPSHLPNWIQVWGLFMPGLFTGMNNWNHLNTKCRWFKKLLYHMMHLLYFFFIKHLKNRNSLKARITRTLLENNKNL